MLKNSSVTSETIVHLCFDESPSSWIFFISYMHNARSITVLWFIIAFISYIIVIFVLFTFYYTFVLIITTYIFINFFFNYRNEFFFNCFRIFQFFTAAIFYFTCAKTPTKFQYGCLLNLLSIEIIFITTWH